MTEFLNIKEDDRIAVVAPHPDDECIGVGGLLALYPEILDVYVLTDGSLGNEDVSQEEERRIRKKQFEAEMKCAGIRTFSLFDYPDGRLMDFECCFNDIDLSKYTKIFLPYGKDTHPDHIATYVYAMQAIKKRNIQHIDIFQYEVHIPIPNPNYFMDISSVLEKKLELIRCHEDQIEQFRYDILMKSLGKYRSCQLNMPENYAEAYLKTYMSDKEEGLLLKIMMESKRNQDIQNIMYLWMCMLMKGDGIANSLKKDNKTRISIYGYGRIGQLFHRELINEGISVIDVIDKKKLVTIDNDITKGIDESTTEVDAVIITVHGDIVKVREALICRGFKNVISLQEMIKMNSHYETR